MAGIVERLRKGIEWTGPTQDDTGQTENLMDEAADEITRLRNELHIAQEWSARVIAGHEHDMAEITSLRAEVEKLKAARDLVLEEAARVAEDYEGKGMEIDYIRQSGDASRTRSDIAAAIRALKSGGATPSQSDG